MKNRVAIIILLIIIIIFFPWYVVNTSEAIYEKHIELLNERIELLEEIIIDYETIDALNFELEQIKVTQGEYDKLDQKWIEWIGQNMWICEVEWGE